MKNEGGFTLVELLTVIALIGILASLSLQGFSLYKAGAAYAVAETTLRNAQTSVTAGTADPDNLPGPVSLGSQTSPGPIADSAARAFMPAMQVPRNVKITYGYDPTCVDGACGYESFLQVNHCQAKEFIRWTRFGDGVELIERNVAGAGCP